MKVLIIDTSSSAASVAVFDHDLLVGEFILNTPKTHSQKLMPLIEHLLELLHLKIKDFDLFVACEGPGSFTGVRIGLSTIKAFAHPFNTKVITATSMSMLAGAVPHFKGIIVPMIDAKREEVYYGKFMWQNEQLIRLDEGVASLRLLLDELVIKHPNQEILLMGDATEIYKEILDAYPQIKKPHLPPEAQEDEAHTNWTIAEEMLNIPRASNLKFLLKQDYKAMGYNDVRANYMRKSQAERDLI